MVNFCLVPFSPNEIYTRDFFRKYGHFGFMVNFCLFPPWTIYPDPEPSVMYCQTVTSQQSLASLLSLEVGPVDVAELGGADHAERHFGA